MIVSLPESHHKPNAKRKQRPIKIIKPTAGKEEIERLMKLARATRDITRKYND